MYRNSPTFLTATSALNLYWSSKKTTQEISTYKSIPSANTANQLSWREPLWGKSVRDPSEAALAGVTKKYIRGATPQAEAIASSGENREDQLS